MHTTCPNLNHILRGLVLDKFEITGILLSLVTESGLLSHKGLTSRVIKWMSGPKVQFSRSFVWSLSIVYSHPPDSVFYTGIFVFTVWHILSQQDPMQYWKFDCLWNQIFCKLSQTYVNYISQSLRHNYIGVCTFLTSISVFLSINSVKTSILIFLSNKNSMKKKILETWFLKFFVLHLISNKSSLQLQQHNFHWSHSLVIVL